MDTLWRDLVYGARGLTRTPAFSIVVILTLALGIGGNSAIFSVVNGILLRSLPVAEPERLAVVWESRVRETDGFMFASPPNYADWRRDARAFQDLGAYSARDFFIELDDETIRVHGARVTASLFPVLGVTPAIGRGFGEEEDRTGAGPVALISERLWRARFNADPAVIGRAISLGDGEYTILGVMPAEFHFPPPLDLEGRTFPRQNDLWVPLAMDLAGANRSAHFLTVIGRLAPGATLEQASSEMSAIADRLAQTFPQSNAEYRIQLVPFERVVVGDLRLALLVLLGAVGVVLLIACVNVANLLLTRSAARQREYAIRAAIGAGRWPLVRTAIIESQLLALAGGALGLLLAYAGVAALLRLAPANLPRLDQVRVDATVAAYTLGIALVTGFAFGLVPALRSFSPGLGGLLRSGGRGSGASAEHTRLRSALVVAEVALSLVLLVGAGLLFHSFLALRAVETGVQPERVLTLRTTLAANQFPEATRVVATYAELEKRLAALPGVEAAAFTFDVPLARDHQGTRVLIEGDPQPPAGEEPRTHFTIVSPGYFDVMGIPILAGRPFRPEDTADAPLAVIVNQTFARLYLGGRNPLGIRLLGFGGPLSIVGVAGDVRLETLTDDATPTMYTPHAQQPNAVRSMSLVVRARQEPANMVTTVRDEIRAVHRAIPVYDIKTMTEVQSEYMAQPRFSALMLLTFSSIALLLAGIGLYGVISFMVTTQTRAIGIRMALGASPHDEMSRVVIGGLRLLGLGIAIGLPGALAAGRVLRSLLFEVGAVDPATMAATTAFLVAVGVLACAVPAWRASRTDPVVALRYE